MTTMMLIMMKPFVSAASDTLEISFGDITIPIEGENINVRIPYDKHGKTIFGRCISFGVMK